MPVHGGGASTGKKKKKKDKKKKGMRKGFENEPFLTVDLEKQAGVIEGVTGPDPNDGHTHRFFVKVENGFVRGHTDSENGHVHEIQESAILPGGTQRLMTSMNNGPQGVPHVHDFTIPT